MNITGIIKNPLTIIAIFAGIVEIGSNTVLPFLTDENQSTYIWFLMIFPILLVLCFFYILYNKHEVLYAPSDFSNDDTFKDVLFNRRKSTNIEVEEKIEEEIIEIAKIKEKQDIEKENSITENDTHQTNESKTYTENDDLFLYFRNFITTKRSSLKIVEKHLLDRIKLNFSEYLEKEITIEDNNGNNIIADGAIFNKKSNSLNLVEVKMSSRRIVFKHTIHKYIIRNEKILNNLSHENFTLTFIVLTPDIHIKNSYFTIEKQLKDKYNINIKIIPFIITSISDSSIEYKNINGEKETISLD